MKIAVVTCYKHNDYVRARALRTAVAACPGVEALVIRNRHTNFLRFAEGLLRICKARIFDRPDVYIITFRGYEMLLFMRLTLVRKPIIFDELVNFTEWMEEHRRLKHESSSYRLFRQWNSWVVKRCRFILADTEAHAEYSAKLNKLSIDRYRTVPVCADETVFYPKEVNRHQKRTFTVLYYGTMLPLHGVECVLEAAKLLKDNVSIQFHFIGGKRESRIAQDCAAAAAGGARVSHEGWIPFQKLPHAINDAGLVLGGPLGDTLQSQFVITGKTYQALATAAPVLIGENQVHEGFSDKQNCLIVPQADPKALAGAIAWAHEHPQELAQIGQAGRKLYETHFSQIIVNRLIRETVEEL